MSRPAAAHINDPVRPPIEPLVPTPPAWVQDLFRGASGDLAPASVELNGPLEVRRANGLARVTTTIPDAASLDASALSLAVAGRYAAMSRLLAGIRKQPIRFWNYVPGIVEPIASDMDRYMAFNRGRHDAFRETWTTPEGFERSVPAASAIGIEGRDLVIDCLCSDSGGTPVENPRQISSWRYSPRYGPRPPCFARGSITTISGRRLLLLAGTASIVGEESWHPGDASAQVSEILRNIEALIVTAGGSRRDALEQLTDLRIYVVRPGDIELVYRDVRARTRSDIRIESAVARVCRPELLVEIEGVAAL